MRREVVTGPGLSWLSTWGDRLAGGGQARPEAGGSRSHLEKCLDFQLDPRFKFPFGPKFQARLLQEKKIDVSRLAGFTSVPRKLPSVKPWTPC